LGGCGAARALPLPMCPPSPTESAWDSTGPATQQCPCRGGHHGQAVSRQRRTRRSVHLTAVPTSLPSSRAACRPWSTPVSVVPLPSSDSPASASPASAPPQQRPVLSVAEAADLLGVSQWLVLRQVGRGAIPHKRVGRRILFPCAGFLAWLESTDQESSDQRDRSVWQASDGRPPPVVVVLGMHVADRAVWVTATRGVSAVGDTVGRGAVGVEEEGRLASEQRLPAGDQDFGRGSRQVALGQAVGQGGEVLHVHLLRDRYEGLGQAVR